MYSVGRWLATFVFSFFLMAGVLAVHDTARVPAIVLAVAAFVVLQLVMHSGWNRR